MHTQGGNEKNKRTTRERPGVVRGKKSLRKRESERKSERKRKRERKNQSLKLKKVCSELNLPELKIFCPREHPVKATSEEGLKGAKE